MNVIRKLKTSPDGDDDITTLERRISGLQTRDDAITKQIIRVEGTTASVKIDQSEEIAAAEALLGGAKFQRPREQPISHLAMLHAERDTVRRALKIGLRRLESLREERAGEIWKAHFTEIAEIEKRRILLAFELQAVNRQREVLREKIRAAGGSPLLPTDGANLLELGNIHDEVSWGAHRLIADGIATAAEIERAKAR